MIFEVVIKSIYYQAFDRPVFAGEYWIFDSTCMYVGGSTTFEASS